ncbi:MAG: protein kinase [Acidobacteria bacterium]|nr:protein kinase [Acidobacteriota bacterium]
MNAVTFDSPDQRIKALVTALDGRYEFLSLLGEGGFSNVYSVRNVGLGRVEALKVLLHSPGGRDALEFAIRFEQEARIVASLDHPNIVKVFDFGTSAGIHWFSMQFIPGASLSQKIDNHAPMSEAQAVEILLPVLDALEYAHQRGIVHRDLKPANILFDADGRPYVTDFGLAKPKGSPGLTKTNVLMGTPHFLAPEQVRGKTLDHRSDLYSLSVTLYEMLTATTPFSAYDGMEAVVAKLSHDPPPARQLRPELALSFEGVLLRGLARNPQNRFQSAREMANALERALERREEWLSIERVPDSDTEIIFEETVFEPDAGEAGPPGPADPGRALSREASPPGTFRPSRPPEERGPVSPPRAASSVVPALPPESPASRTSRGLQLFAMAVLSGIVMVVLGVVLSRRPPVSSPELSLPARPERAPEPRVSTPLPEPAQAEASSPSRETPGPQPTLAPVPSPSPRAVAVPDERPAPPRPWTPPVQVSDGDPESLAGMPEACAGKAVPATVIVGADGAVKSVRTLSKENRECWTAAERYLKTLRFEPARAQDGSPVESLPLAVSVTLGTSRAP